MACLTFCRLFQLIILLISLCASFPLFGQYCSFDKLTASDASAFDETGRSVSVGKTYAIVGSTAKNNGQGVAYIYKFNGTTWQQTAILSGSIASPYRGFGTSVHIDDVFAIIGTYGQGTVYVFKREGEAWVEKAVLTKDGTGGTPSGSNSFGWSLGMGGGFLIVGSYSDGGGAAYIFKQEDDTGTKWTRQARLVGHSGFGYSVAISGNVAIATSAYDGTFEDNTPGAAYIFERIGDKWVQQVKLKTEREYTGGLFGIDSDIYQNSLTGERIAVVGNDSHGVHVYKYVDGTWIYDQFIGDQNSPVSGRFGFSVDLESNNLLIGQPYLGAAWLYKYKDKTFQYQQRFEAPDKHAFQQFGHSVALSKAGGNLIVGAIADNEKAESAGAAYVLASGQINPISPICWKSDPLVLTASPAGGNWRGEGITNTSTGTFDPGIAGIGSHQIIYEYTNASCTGRDTAIIEVRERSLPISITTGPTVYLCQGASIALTTTPVAGQAYQWQYAPEKEGVFSPAPGENTLSTYQASQKGYYRVTSATQGCSSAISDAVSVEELFVKTNLSSAQICRDNSVTLRVAESNGNGFRWQYASTANGVYTDAPGDNSLADYRVTREGYYRVVATANNSCSTVSHPVPVIGVFARVNINPPPSICESHQPVQLEGIPAGGRWVGKGISETGSFDPARAGMGMHIIQYAVQIGECTYSATVPVEVKALPRVLLENNSPIEFCQNEPVSLRVTAVANAIYDWEYANAKDKEYRRLPASNASVYSATEPGFYRAKVNRAGCIAYSPAIELIALKDSTKFPNVFTPNGDGFNDTFELVIQNVNQYELEVYNRYGRRVFASTSIANQWDGQGFSAGIYFYLVRYHTVCNKKTKVINGTISILY
jgi:gliding motility-associated-like protein